MLKRLSRRLSVEIDGKVRSFSDPKLIVLLLYLDSQKRAKKIDSFSNEVTLIPYESECGNVRKLLSKAYSVSGGHKTYYWLVSKDVEASKNIAKKFGSSSLPENASVEVLGVNDLKNGKRFQKSLGVFLELKKSESRRGISVFMGNTRIFGLGRWTVNKFLEKAMSGCHICISLISQNSLSDVSLAFNETPGYINKKCLKLLGVTYTRAFISTSMFLNSFKKAGNLVMASLKGEENSFSNAVDRCFEANEDYLSSLRNTVENLVLAKESSREVFSGNMLEASSEDVTEIEEA